MKIILAPDKFKGSLSAKEICQIIYETIKEKRPDIDVLIHPLADGGDGSLELIREYKTLSSATVATVDPLGRKISASYLHNDDEAFIELASASGHVLLKKEELNPMHCSSFGTGLMIKHAIVKGIKKIYLFIGGSATNDAGTGILEALGYQLLDNSGNIIQAKGENLLLIDNIETPKEAVGASVSFILLCDVDNPLYGQEGAAYCYARQKGADTSGINTLDKGLRNFAKVVYKLKGINLQELPGGGAAGGVPAGLYAFLNAELMPGASTLISLSNFEEALENADVIITGEGRLDFQSKRGKLVSVLTDLAHKHDKKIFYFVGTYDNEALNHYGKRNIFALSDIASNLDDAIENAKTLLVQMVNRFLEYI